jgi:hypothetical protein
MTVLCKTFAGFRSQVNTNNQSTLVIQLGRFKPDLRHRHLVDGFYHISENNIYCEYRHKIAKWKMDLHGLESDCTEIRISGNLPSAWVFPHETIHQFILYKLGQSGFAFIHALGISRAGMADLIMGRSGIGKSTLGGKYFRDGYSLLGDDTVFIDANGWVYGFPLPLGFRQLSNMMAEYGLQMTVYDHFSWQFTRFIKTVTLSKIGLLFRVSALRLGGRLENRAKLKRGLFALPGENFSLTKKPIPELFLNRIMASNRFEMVLLSKLIEAYTYIFPSSPVQNYFKNQELILKSAFSQSRIFNVVIPRQISEKVYSDLQEALQNE